ncbi:PREDICTED: sialate O-acetylesterase isoform X2 [Ficedula albicollis]|uniref:sialate O-acetylesterase isoform X2 n=1 Tax=Ficedula albicollis TaxID=59894 RepID=UPI0007AD8A00|nr:PREDICTED: sialate O-acetylesterase isoform X2 [Ficedula albicollis]
MAAWALLALLAVAPAAAGGMLSFASYYGDHMVLQKKPSGAVVWGHGELGAMVTVTLSGASGLIIMEKTAQVKGPSGTWITVLDPMDQGGPYALMAEQGLENVTLRDIYFGDVWLCSGQSNMAMTVLQVANASQELAAAAHYPYVRIFAAAPARSDVELEDLEHIDLPWSIPTAVLSSSTSPHQYLSGPQTPSVLWNAMIHPLLNMTLRGVAWYQGEANTFLNTDQYNCTFPALIADWRRAFHTGSAGQTEPLLPFGFVQLSTYRRRSADDSFARLRWHQTADLGLVPNARMPSTFMAVAMDLGDEHSPYGSIHPRDKQNVAHRLLLGARAVAYGDKDVVFQGPYPTQAILEVARGLLNVTYSQELICRQRVAQAFEVCCCSQASPCQWLPAPVVAVESRTVTLALSGCRTLVLGLRYAWAEWPCEYQACPLYNPQGLPAPPFLLDTLPAGNAAGGRELLLLPGSRFPLN